MSTNDQDKLKEDLEHLARQYAREAGEEPPELLDKAVLNAARRAVETRATRPWNFGWMHATASVALVVLGLAIVLDLRSTAEIPDATEQPRPALREERADADVAESEAVDTVEAYRQSEARQMETLQETQKSELMQDLREQALVPAAPSAAADPPVVIIRPAPPLRDQAGLDAEAVESDRDENAWNLKRSVGTAQSTATPERNENAQVEQKLSGDVLVFGSAEEWLDYIVGLSQIGEEQAWRSELEAFRQAFPGHPVPQELLDLESDETDRGG